MGGGSPVRTADLTRRIRSFLEGIKDDGDDNRHVSLKSSALADRQGRICAMPDRVMFVQLKMGYDADQGSAWISVVWFSRIS